MKDKSSISSPSRTTRFVARREMPVPVEALRDWHFQEGAFERLLPPFDPVTVVEPAWPIEVGRRFHFKIHTGPFRIAWHGRYEGYEDLESGLGFCDVLENGPFAFWRHLHRFLPDVDNPHCSVLEDDITFALPGGWLGRVLGAGLVRRKLFRAMRYRHEVLYRDLSRWESTRPRILMVPDRPSDTFTDTGAPHPDDVGQETAAEDVKWADACGAVLVTGATGLIGSALVPFLQTRKHSVYRLTRSPVISRDIGWNPADGVVDWQEEDRHRSWSAVVHLAGENISKGRWTSTRRKRLIESRVNSTRLLIENIKKFEQPPKVFICASGINYYHRLSVETDGGRSSRSMQKPGDPHPDADVDGLAAFPFDATTGSEWTEDAPAGDSFLAELCAAWESEALRAEALGMRVVMLRLGIVLSPAGGALKLMLPVFKAGLGGPLGGGHQRVGWITLDDLLDIILLSITDPAISGAVNCLAPGFLSQRAFARELGKVLRRPAVLPAPRFAINAIFGQMGRETVLADLPARPARLESLGYPWRFPSVRNALAHVLGKEL